MAGVTEQVIEKIKEALGDERNLTKSEISALETRINAAFENSKAEDRQQLIGLQSALDEIKAYHAEQKAAQSERDKISDSHNTIVVPPSDVKPAQPEQPEDPPAVAGEEVKRSIFKKIW